MLLLLWGYTEIRMRQGVSSIVLFALIALSVPSPVIAEDGIVEEPAQEETITFEESEDLPLVIEEEPEGDEPPEVPLIKEKTGEELTSIPEEPKSMEEPAPIPEEPIVSDILKELEEPMFNLFLAPLVVDKTLASVGDGNTIVYDFPTAV